MKKAIMILLALLLWVPIPARAAEAENMQALLESWGDWRPDYISGIWSNDGSLEHLTVGLVEGYSDQVLLSQLRDTTGLTIVYQKYSWNELRALQQTLEGDMRKNYGLLTLGVDVYENRLVVEFSEDHRDSALTLEYIRRVTETYGDRVDIRFTDLIIQVTDTPGDIWMCEPVRRTRPTVFLMMGSMTLLLAALWCLRQRQYKLLTLGPAGTRSLREMRVTQKLRQPLACPRQVDRRLEETLGIELPDES